MLLGHRFDSKITVLHFLQCLLANHYENLPMHYTENFFRAKFVNFIGKILIFVLKLFILFEPLTHVDAFLHMKWHLTILI